MAIVEQLQGKSPQIGKGTWLAPNATLIGDVHMGEGCSIWYQAVVRGDVGAIVFGDHVNIQDGAVVHCTTGKSSVHLGNRVSVGHRAIVHGCTAEDDVLIGMGAIVMDNAYLERGSIVAAGAVVLENTRVKAGTIWAGVPAKQVKQRDVETAVSDVRKTAEAYVYYKTWYEKDGL
jgi:carbonic anhydrase/acetyltransferase-like protein (isoleucine patch superfamily)